MDFNLCKTILCYLFDFILYNKVERWRMEFGSPISDSLRKGWRQRSQRCQIQIDGRHGLYFVFEVVHLVEYFVLLYPCKNTFILDFNFNTT